jgi:Carbon starvation protein CstA
MALLAVGIILVQPELKMPAVTKFIDGTGPVWSGSLFPFLFITIACVRCHFLARLRHAAPCDEGRLRGINRKSRGDGQTDANDPLRTLGPD